MVSVAAGMVAATGVVECGEGADMAGRSGPKATDPQLPEVLGPPDADGLVDEADWWRVDASGADYAGAVAANFHIEQCRFTRADLSGGRWRGGVWRDCVFDHGDLANVFAESGSAFRSRFTDVRMTGLQWTDGVVKDVTFTGCRMDLTGFRFTRLSGTVFTDCRMTSVDFTGADLTGVVLRRCDLTGAKFHQVKMAGARVEDCVIDDVSGVEFLRGATVKAADLIPLTFALARALGITVEVD